MRTIAVSASVLLVLAVGVAAAEAEASSQAQRSAFRSLETLNVPSNRGGKAPVITSRTKLRRGRRYRLVVDGVFTTRGGPGTPYASTVDHIDALYCYDTINPYLPYGPGCGVRRTGPLYFLQLKHGSFEGPLDLIDKPKDTSRRGRLAFNPSHHYAVTFKARSTGRLRARIANNALPELRFGSIKVQIQRQSSKLLRGCPKPTSSASARAAASCTWVVDFGVVQDGFPSNVLRPPYEDLVGTETTVVGKLFFNDKPEKEKTALGSVAAVAFHSDQFLNPGLTTQEAALVLKPARGYGTYRYGPDEKTIRIDLNVESSALSPGPAQPIDAIGGEVATILEDVTGASDRLVWQSFNPRPSTHRHVWDNGNPASNRVQVKISLPKRL